MMKTLFTILSLTTASFGGIQENNIVKESLRVIPNFPKEGIQFYDISTLLANPKAYQTMLDIFHERYKDQKIDAFIGIDARGFIMAAALADRMNVAFIMARKPNKLPGEIYTASYAKEYGTDSLTLSKGILKSGAHVVIMDDLIATGGSAQAAVELARKAGFHVVETAAIVELAALNGRKKITSPVFSIVVDTKVA